MKTPLRRTLGRTGLQVSEVGLGTSKGLAEKLSREEGERLVARAIDLGVNFIDSARHYGRGEAEARVGSGVRGQREEIHICTKCGTVPGGGRDFSRRGILKAMDDSLRKLGTDHVDVYMLHMAGPSQLGSGCEAIDALLELKEEGKTRFIGASVDGEMMWRALELDALDVLEITYNIADLYPEEGFLDAAEKKGIGLVIKEPYPPWAADQWRRLQHYDFLKDESRMSAVEVALRFVLSSSQIHTAVPATSNTEHLEFNVGLSDGRKLPDDICRLVRGCYCKATAGVEGTHNFSC